MDAIKDDFLVECVVNISEGRDEEKINRISSVFDTHPEVKLLNIDTGQAANRSVLTIMGPCDDLLAAIGDLYIKTLDEVDMSQHQGNHPRIGAVDVCPFIPLKRDNTERLKHKVLSLAEEISKRIEAPVFLYAESSVGKVKTLPQIRKGDYETMIQHPSKMTFVPDYGSNYSNPRFGASVIGVRDFMVAYNVNIDTKDIVVAKQIARRMREIRNEKGNYRGKNIKPLQILGWYVEEFNTCQISTNIHNPRELSMLDVFEFTREIAKEYDIQVHTSELIGMIPLFALDMMEGRVTKEKGITSALGLNFLGDFDLNTRILEKRYLR